MGIGKREKGAIGALLLVELENRRLKRKAEEAERRRSSLPKCQGFRSCMIRAGTQYWTGTRWSDVPNNVKLYLSRANAENVVSYARLSLRTETPIEIVDVQVSFAQEQ